MFTEHTSEQSNKGSTFSFQTAFGARTDETGEAEFIERLLTDDPRAWREFNTRYSRLIYSCIGRVLSRFASVTTADDTNEVYATLCVQLLANDKKKLRSFDSGRGSKLGSWLGMLAVHAAYDHLRLVKRTPMYTPLAEAEVLSSEQPSPYEVSMVRERAERVWNVMGKLSAKDQAFVRLYFGEGMAPEKIAEELGISVKTVYSKKHKIGAKLEALLKEPRLAA
jgi:RNA polymerase sigma-70 factor (ECF subfamily)